MHLIFIRHAEPDYAKDSLTPKGWREAGLLAGRLKDWRVDDVYLSPLGRARDTARPCLEAWNKEARVLEWLREFRPPVNDPMRGRKCVAWDFLPEYWTRIPGMYDKDAFAETSLMKEAGVGEEYLWVCRELDALLASYGYVRDGGFYRTDGTDPARRDKTVVCFCHLGITLYLVSYLLGVSPVVFTSGIFLAPSSVTVLGTEERHPGIAFFRAQCIGDTGHLRSGGEPVSEKGYFTAPFQG